MPILTLEAMQQTCELCDQPVDSQCQNEFCPGNAEVIDLVEDLDGDG